MTRFVMNDVTGIREGELVETGTLSQMFQEALKNGCHPFIVSSPPRNGREKHGDPTVVVYTEDLDVEGDWAWDVFYVDGKA